MRRSTRITTHLGGTVAVAAILAFTVAGCSSHSSSSSTKALRQANGGSVPDGVVSAAPANAPDASGGGTASDKSDSYSAAKLALGTPSVIRTADLTVSSSSVGQQADRARVIVSGVGGSVDGDDRTSGTNATATMVLRVPPDTLGAVLTRLAALGKEQSRHLTTRDVTTEVADVDSRVRSAASAIAQLRDLYAKATRVQDIITIESELNQRESDLESLQAQQRALAGQVAMATVTLYLTTPLAAAHHHGSHSGFGGGLANGWHAFARGVAGTVTVIGAGLPFALLLVLLVVGWRGLARYRSSRAASSS